jgi:transcriptional regulator with XRE-family HTH domain
MASGPAVHARCDLCERSFPQVQGPGRKRRYCSRGCRRRAQRLRDAKAPVTAPRPAPERLGREIAVELQRLAGRLADAESTGEPLAGLLERVGALAQELEYYTAGAVHDARQAGTSWEDIGRAAGVTAGTARSRWAKDRVARLLHRRARRGGPAPHGPPADRAGEVPPGGVQGPAPGLPGGPAPAPAGRGAEGPASAWALARLGAALAHLQRTSGLTTAAVAERMLLSPSYVSVILAGQRIPSWDLVVTLSVAFGGDPARLRILWELARGITVPAGQPAGVQAERLHAALGGLHLAAGCPSTEAIERACDGRLAAPLIEQVLSGTHIPEWEPLSSLVVALNGRPAGIRPLWDAVHRGLLPGGDGSPDGIAEHECAAPGQG